MCCGKQQTSGRERLLAHIYDRWKRILLCYGILSCRHVYKTSANYRRTYHCVIVVNFTEFAKLCGAIHQLSRAESAHEAKLNARRTLDLRFEVNLNKYCLKPNVPLHHFFVSSRQHERRHTELQNGSRKRQAPKSGERIRTQWKGVEAWGDLGGALQCCV